MSANNSNGSSDGGDSDFLFAEHEGGESGTTTMSMPLGEFGRKLADARAQGFADGQRFSATANRILCQQVHELQEALVAREAEMERWKRKALQAELELAKSELFLQTFEEQLAQTEARLRQEVDARERLRRHAVALDAEVAVLQARCSDHARTVGLLGDWLDTVREDRAELVERVRALGS